MKHDFPPSAAAFDPRRIWRPLGGACLLVIALALGGCQSHLITPATVRESLLPEAEKAAALHRWEEAVDIANYFLGSPYRRTLPDGRFVYAESGMRFESGGRVWPIQVKHDPIGQLCVNFGFVAQERSDGFAIGRVRPRRDVRIDNTWFKDRAGHPNNAATMAALLLHETTHVVLRDGTVSFWKSIGYYGEAAVTFRYRTLTGERRPYATSEEFEWFVRATHTESSLQPQLLVQFNAHLAHGDTKRCRHGPFTVPSR